jgi:hypothetical protein
MLIIDKECMVFIHKIIKKNGNFKFDDDTIKKNISEETNDGRLYFFKNYYELSQIFLDLKLLDQESVEKIKNAVKSTLEKKENKYDDNINKKNYYCCDATECKHGCIEEGKKI